MMLMLFCPSVSLLFTEFKKAPRAESQNVPLMRCFYDRDGEGSVQLLLEMTMVDLLNT